MRYKEAEVKKMDMDEAVPEIEEINEVLKELDSMDN